MRRAAKIDANQPDIVKQKIFGIWQCKLCGKEARATVHQLRKKYCSKKCEAEDYRVRMVGESNPNYRNAGKHVCSICGEEFFNYVKSRKYCSFECYNKSRTKPKPSKPMTQLKLSLGRPVVFKKQSKKAEKFCLQCGSIFLSYPVQEQMYCSYQCYLDSGGAFRAGIAASKATMRYGAKKDANHKDIFNEIRKYCPAHDLSNMGHGLPDGIAWINNGWYFFDVKNPKTGYGRRGLNKIQKKWASQWEGGPVYLIYTTDEAMRFAQGDFSELKFEPSSGGKDTVESPEHAIQVLQWASKI